MFYSDVAWGHMKQWLEMNIELQKDIMKKLENTHKNTDAYNLAKIQSETLESVLSHMLENEKHCTY